MLDSIIVIAVFFLASSSALKSGGRGDIITPRPYNNPYSDASAARDDKHL